MEAPSNKNGIPFSSLSVMTVYTGVVFLEGPAFQEVSRLLAYLEGRPVYTTETTTVSLKWAPYLASLFPLLAPFDERYMVTQPAHMRLAIGLVLQKALGHTLMVPHPGVTNGTVS